MIFIYLTVFFSGCSFSKHICKFFLFYALDFRGRCWCLQLKSQNDQQLKVFHFLRIAQKCVGLKGLKVFSASQPMDGICESVGILMENLFGLEFAVQFDVQFDVPFANTKNFERNDSNKIFSEKVD